MFTYESASAAGMKLYVDGSLRTTSSIEDVVINGDFDDTADNTPGAADGTGGVEFLTGTSFTGAADFKGYLDDFAVYSRTNGEHMDIFTELSS